ncbi:hypothetical protein [Massilia cavernae]|uniref:hypothetical protein n=1 Tax=Massilia cavernae TaxID=2320864 RepID=UPI0011C3FFCC|nr:hypothetical protein [Massilia cavernae]
MTSQNARIHAVFNKLPGLEAKIYANKIKHLGDHAAARQSIDEANSYKTGQRGITDNRQRQRQNFLTNAPRSPTVAACHRPTMN